MRRWLSAAARGGSAAPVAASSTASQPPCCLLPLFLFSPSLRLLRLRLEVDLAGNAGQLLVGFLLLVQRLAEQIPAS
jgi:hypothetical protein